MRHGRMRKAACARPPKRIASGFPLVGRVQTACGWLREIVRCNAQAVGLEVRPRRKVFERTFVWLGKCHWLSMDYEELPESSASAICDDLYRDDSCHAPIHVMLRRMAKSEDLSNTL
jgi:hypothetical protein